MLLIALCYRSRELLGTSDLPILLNYFRLELFMLVLVGSCKVYVLLPSAQLVATLKILYILLFISLDKNCCHTQLPRWSYVHYVFMKSKSCFVLLESVMVYYAAENLNLWILYKRPSANRNISLSVRNCSIAIRSLTQVGYARSILVTLKLTARNPSVRKRGCSVRLQNVCVRCLFCARGVCAPKHCGLQRQVKNGSVRHPTGNTNFLSLLRTMLSGMQR